jgi:hypothetical protein
MTSDQYVSFSWGGVCVIVIRRLLDRNEIGLASFFIQGIICILHVAILHLFSTLSFQRPDDRVSQEQQTDHPPISPSGVTSASEHAEVLEGTIHKKSR